ncbi:IS256 family transposase [Micromonospora carbonacea]|uniref:Mutator family transposase n=1 Tax=Micromonospora carbonacea TaxID=47853 RepID=A0A7H8XTK1_9ACTN|nr:IS256 family transposase [Micromonospora carbonacea]MBB5825790.1 transposase-like protein [Micromonospora carbonacea]MBB5825820.1 transposase-like protein [Micromonospora carbonacea]MBB5828584.1 transposase-like protein [Micromonospora carbonacea]MBB5829032.1 transposase-like protein [Micromonospora carbonacea]MBB5829541.1 transposase-like protein [Micromonospora carbonacea]
MAASESVNPVDLLREQIEGASPDVLQAMIKTFAQAVMSAEADAICGAGYGQRSDERVNSRNGYRPREWDTRAGTIDLAIPKLRQGSYFPDWLLTHRRRAEQALVSVVATSYLLGVSTRRVEKLVEQLGIRQLSKSQVSEMAAHLDAQVEAFRNRPLDAAHYTFVWTDALTMKVREHGRTVNVHALVAVGVNADGQREVLGVDVASDEDGAGWLAFLRSLTARGLSGVQLVISDAHRGLVAAIGAALPGAAWQRCRTHYLRNLLTKVPRSAQPWIATLVRTIFDQPDADAVHAQFRRVVATIEAKFPAAAEHLDAARDDLLAFTGFPREIWRQIWSNNPQERLNKEIRRRTDVVGIFPNRAAIIRLVGAVLAEQTDEWTERRRYMGLELLAKARLITVDTRQHDTDQPNAAPIAA